MTGPATNIISGTAVGMETTATTAVTISLALIASYAAGAQTGLPHGGIYGTAIATMGMLMTAGVYPGNGYLRSDNRQCGRYSPNVSRASGTREITDNLDAVGNTTKALTKGYAIGSAALAAFLLFSAYLDKVTEVMHIRGLLEAGERFDVVNLANVNTFVGALLGAMLVFLFSSLAIRAVGRAGSDNIEEVRRQFPREPRNHGRYGKTGLCSLC